MRSRKFERAGIAWCENEGAFEATVTVGGERFRTLHPTIEAAQIYRDEMLRLFFDQKAKPYWPDDEELSLWTWANCMKDSLRKNLEIN